MALSGALKGGIKESTKLEEFFNKMTEESISLGKTSGLVAHTFLEAIRGVYALSLESKDVSKEVAEAFGKVFKIRIKD